jgi:hypothetical protein
MNCVDADLDEGLTRMVSSSCMVQDEEIMGLCGESNLLRTRPRRLSQLALFFICYADLKFSFW